MLSQEVLVHQKQIQKAAAIPGEKLGQEQPASLSVTIPVFEMLIDGAAVPGKNLEVLASGGGKKGRGR